MMTHLTREQMLERWRLHRMLQPVRNDASITRTDGFDMDTLLMSEMDAWYHRYLDTAPLHMLNVTDIASSILIGATVNGSGHCYTVQLPDNVRRVAAVRLSGWRRNARIVTDASPGLIARLESDFTTPGISTPVALLADGVLQLFPAKGSLQRLEVVLYSSDSYDFDDSALAEIEPIS